MIESLLAADISLFHAINGVWTNVVFDAFFPFVTNLNHQPAVLALVLAMMIWGVWRGGPQGRRAVLAVILTILLSDQLNSFVLKDIFGRIRPCHALAEFRLLVNCGSGLAFPSSHAVNTFAGSIVVAYFYPRALWYLVAYALTVAYSRVYVGVHYPSDVVGGAAIGLMLGGGMLWALLAVDAEISNMRRTR